MAIMEQVGVERFLRRARWLDQFGEQLQGVVNGAFTNTGPAGIRIRNFLNGTWLGRPLHAAVSDAPVGLWTGAAIFDVLSIVTGDRRFRHAADWCVGLGIGAGAITALSGLADYSKLEDPQRDAATLHALIQTTGTANYIASLVQRSRGNRSAGLVFGFIGYGLIAFGADLGGYLVYNLGTLVSRQAWQQPPTTFTPVLAASELANNTLRCAEANGYKVLLARVNGQIYAIGDTCSHWGCSLAGGHLMGDVVKCPCHGSEFNLRNGSVVEGPASQPEPYFEVREENGQILVRLAPDSVV
ncbi:MAG TPA: Rieske 2Fe-2S domain-containing protein [Chloroflexota bacterium]|nr:Rieske 2Fe-2S domain-containing protein [Chloroflexota bacterium]